MCPRRLHLWSLAPWQLQAGRSPMPSFRLSVCLLLPLLAWHHAWRCPATTIITMEVVRASKAPRFPTAWAFLALSASPPQFWLRAGRRRWQLPFPIFLLQLLVLLVLLAACNPPAPFTYPRPSRRWNSPSPRRTIPSRTPRAPPPTS